MRAVLAFLAALVGLAALGALALDVSAAGPLRLRVLGEVWFELHPDSFQLLQPAVERHLHPAVWDYAVEPLIFAPAVAVLAGIAVVLFLLSRFFRGPAPERLA